MLITMAGIRASGKTCYLYATYNAMMDGMDTLLFNPNSPLDSQDLYDLWNSMIENKEFPPGTSESREFSFTVIYSNEVLDTFTWYDYKGSLLQEKDPAAYKKFESRCLKSNCVVFALPADLIKATLNNEPRYMNGAGNVQRDFRIYQQSILNLRVKKPSMPIVINVTKGDLLTGKEMERTVEEIIKPKFSLLFGSKGGETLICRTSIQKTLPNGDRDFTPRNVHHPIIFPIYLKLKKSDLTPNLILIRDLLKGSIYFSNGVQVW